LPIWIFLFLLTAYISGVQQPSRRFPWLLWLIAGAIVIAAGFALDDRAQTALNVLGDPALDVPGHPGLKNFAWWVSKSAEGEIIGGIGILLTVIFSRLRRPRLAGQIFFLSASALLIGLAGTILRVLAGRTRPGIHAPEGVAQGFYGIWHDGHFILGQAAFSAFPSGHSAVAAGLAAAATLVNRTWGAVAWVYAFAVMWSRLALQWHHLSDVLASAVLAWPLAWLLKKYLMPHIERRCENFSRR
jgi:membrane-associated phospholipid phosphatase